MDELEEKLGNLINEKQFASAYLLCKQEIDAKRWTNFRLLPNLVRVFVINSKYDELYKFIYSIDSKKKWPLDIQKSIGATLVLLGRAMSMKLLKKEDTKSEVRTVLSDAVFMTNGDIKIVEHSLDIIDSLRDKGLTNDIIKDFKLSFNSQEHLDVYSKFAQRRS